MKPLGCHEIRGNWATLLLAWNDDDSLDIARVADEIDALIAMRLDGIYSNGTAGEFHTLTEGEFDRVAELLADRCERSGTPFQIGVSHMSAQISLERLRRCVPLAPAAVQMILPDWFPVTEAEAVGFLDRMAEAAEGVGIVLYNPPHAKRVLQPAEIGRLAQQIPALVGVKVADGDDAWYAAMREHCGPLSVFVPGHHLATGIWQGAHGAYSNVACLHPGAAQRWWEQIVSDLSVEAAEPRKWDRHRASMTQSQSHFQGEEWDRHQASMLWSQSHFQGEEWDRHRASMTQSQSHFQGCAAFELEQRLRQFMDDHIAPFIRTGGYCNGACDRLLALIGGWTDVGWRMRWPYRSIPASEADRLRLIARESLPEFFPG
jgi:4-hydroxy-tetrahydrodipicolinate synthase